MMKKKKEKPSSIASSEFLSGRLAELSLNSMEKVFRILISIRTRRNDELVKLS